MYEEHFDHNSSTGGLWRVSSNFIKIIRRFKKPVCSCCSRIFIDKKLGEGVVMQINTRKCVHVFAELRVTSNSQIYSVLRCMFIGKR